MNQPASKLRFALLHHHVSRKFESDSGRCDHFDLMLESNTDALLASWAFEENVLLKFASLVLAQDEQANDSTPDVTSNATKVDDHRHAYLDYEGPISQDRGTVSRVCSGTCEWLERTDLRCQFKLNYDSVVCLVTLEKRIDRWVAELRSGKGSSLDLPSTKGFVDRP